MHYISSLTQSCHAKKDCNADVICNGTMLTRQCNKVHGVAMHFITDTILSCNGTLQDRHCDKSIAKMDCQLQCLSSLSPSCNASCYHATHFFHSIVTLQCQSCLKHCLHMRASCIPGQLLGHLSGFALALEFLELLVVLFGVLLVPLSGLVLLAL
jgi:hypothetical protein